MKNTIIAATIATTALLTASPEAKAQNNDFQIVSADQSQFGNQNQIQNGNHNHNRNQIQNGNHNHNRNQIQNGNHNHNQNQIQNGNHNHNQNQIQNGNHNHNQNQIQNGNQNQRHVVSRVPTRNVVEPVVVSTPAGNHQTWVTYAEFMVTYSDDSIDWEYEEISTSNVDPNLQQSQPQVVSRVEMDGFTERFYSHTIPSRLTPAGEHVYKWVTFRVFLVTYSDGHTEKEQIEASTSWVDPNSHS